MNMNPIINLIQHQALEKMMENPDLVTFLRPLMATHCYRLCTSFCGYYCWF